MGMNTRKHFDVRITPNETFFSSTTLPLADNAVHLPIVDSIMTVPVVQIGIAGEKHRLYFDTGAKLAYLHENLLHGQESTGEVNDFIPQSDSLPFRRTVCRSILAGNNQKP